MRSSSEQLIEVVSTQLEEDLEQSEIECDKRVDDLYQLKLKSKFQEE